MGVNDFYKITVHSTGLGVVMKNRYYYRQLSPDANGAQDAVNAWIDSVLPAQLPIMASISSVNFIEAVNLNVLTDFYEASVGGAVGSSTSAALPPYSAWRFKLLRASRSFRPGRKAIGLVPQAQVNDGVAVVQIEAALTAFADALAANIIDPGLSAAEYRPYLLRENGLNPPTEFTPIIGANYVEVSTQSTRKFGRGE